MSGCCEPSDGKLTATNPFQGTMLWNNREVTRTGKWQKILGGQYINIFWFHPAPFTQYRDLGMRPAPQGGFGLKKWYF